MRALKLVSTGLEKEVAEVLGRLEAKAEPGPRGEHDVEVTFPEPFVRKMGAELVKLRSNKKFVVEVKSSQRKGAKLDDLRQTFDWVLRESRRIVPPELTASYLAAVESAKLDVDFRLEGDSLKRSAAENEDASKAVTNFYEAVDLLVTGLNYRVKGLFIINHHAGAGPHGKERPLLEQNIAEFAKVNHIAVMSWQQLLEVAERFEEGHLDPLDFWSMLFETDGVFELFDYDWRARTSFQCSLFDLTEVDMISGAKFLRPEPEAKLRHLWKW